MATAPTRSQAVLFARLIEDLTPEIHRAFMASVTDLQANVNWPELLRQLERNNIESAIAALNINEAAWNEYSSAMTSAYAASGSATAAQIRLIGAGSIGTRFNMTNPRAEEWVRRNVAESITGFTREARETAREVIRAGYALGQGPRTIGLDLVGRVQNGVRTGGIMGLDRPRAERLTRVTQGMRTEEGVRGLVVEHLDGSLGMRYKVNKATENRILAAYRAGTAVPEAQRIISERQYSNALLQARADTVAATETASAVMNARNDEWVQLAESRGLSQEDIIKTWVHGRGGDGRPTHIAIGGTSVRGLNTPFVLYDGSRMLYPHDPNGGARNNINCACACNYRLDHSAGLE